MRSLWTILCLSLLSAFLPAQVPATTPQDTTPLAKALLWRISGNGLTAPSYLFGTIHLIDRDKFRLDSLTRKSLHDARQVVFEFNLDKEMNPLALFGLVPKMMMKDKTLKDLLSDEDYELVRRRAKNAGLPFFLIKKLKPMFTGMMLEAPAGSTDTPDKVSYEMELLDMAKQAGKLIGGLETMAYQMSVFDSIPLDVQAGILVKELRDSTGAAGETDLEQIYISQDIEKMARAANSIGNETVRRYLLVNRNHNWIPVIEEKMQQGTTFFAVGAGHLGGPDGIIRLLRRRGYRVEPVK